MSWQKWCLIGYLVIQALWVVATVDKPRKTRGAAESCVGMIEFGFIAWLVVAS